MARVHLRPESSGEGFAVDDGPRPGRRGGVASARPHSRDPRHLCASIIRLGVRVAELARAATDGVRRERIGAEVGGATRQRRPGDARMYRPRTQTHGRWTVDRRLTTLLGCRYAACFVAHGRLVVVQVEESETRDDDTTNDDAAARCTQIAAPALSRQMPLIAESETSRLLGAELCTAGRRVLCSSPSTQRRPRRLSKLAHAGCQYFARQDLIKRCEGTTKPPNLRLRRLVARQGLRTERQGGNRVTPAGGGGEEGLPACLQRSPPAPLLSAASAQTTRTR